MSNFDNNSVLTEVRKLLELTETQSTEIKRLNEQLKTLEASKNYEIQQLQLTIENQRSTQCAANLLLERYRAETIGESSTGIKIDDLLDITENGSIGMHIVSNQGIILWANKADYSSLGYTREEFVGKPIASFCFNSDEVTTIFSNLMQCKPLKDFKAEMIHKDGSSRFMLVNTSTRLDHAGAFSQTRCFLRDVTDIIRHEQQVIQLQQERNDALTREMEALKIKNQFLDVMSHEIRTPIHGLLGMSSCLLETPLTTEQQEYVDFIKASGSLLMTLTSGMLDMNKIESGGLKFDLSPVDLEEIAMNAMKAIHFEGTKKNLSFTTNFHNIQQHRIFLGDASKITQILLSFTSNSLKFTNFGDSIILSVTSTPTPSRGLYLIRFELKDTGIGIDFEKFIVSNGTSQDVFSPFTQESPEIHRKYGGLGLGLSVSKGLAESMGGSIGIESHKGQGCTVWVDIPMYIVNDTVHPTQSTATSTSTTNNTTTSSSSSLISSATSSPTTVSQENFGKNNNNNHNNNHNQNNKTDDEIDEINYFEDSEGVIPMMSIPSSSSSSLITSTSLSSSSMTTYESEEKQRKEYLQNKKDKKEKNGQHYHPPISIIHTTAIPDVLPPLPTHTPPSTDSLFNLTSNPLLKLDELTFDLSRLSTPTSHTGTPNPTPSPPSSSSLSTSAQFSSSSSSPSSSLTLTNSIRSPSSPIIITTTTTTTTTTNNNNTNNSMDSVLSSTSTLNNNNNNHNNTHINMHSSPSSQTQRPLLPSLSISISSPTLSPTPTPTSLTTSSSSSSSSRVFNPMLTRILVAEDNIVNRKILKNMLDKLQFIDVVMTNDGSQCVEAYLEARKQEKPFDIILMDCLMPNLDGWQATETIRTIEQTIPSMSPPQCLEYPIPIIAVTANAFEKDRQRCLSCGMNDFLAKPMTKEQLNLTIMKWILHPPSCYYSM